MSTCSCGDDAIVIYIIILNDPQLHVLMPV